MRQLDLLEWTPPVATVSMFPPDRRADLVRHTACVLLRCRKQATADIEWRRVVDRLVDEMATRMTDEEIRAALLRFKIAVEREMDRQRGDERRA